MTLTTEPSISLYPTLESNNSLSLRSFIAHLTLDRKLSIEILNLWTDTLNACRQAWWIEIFTAQPKCTYYFGSFAGAQAAHIASKGFVEDLESESAQGIKIKIDRHCQPDSLTIDSWGRAEVVAIYRVCPSEMSGRTTDGVSSKQLVG